MQIRFYFFTWLVNHQYLLFYNSLISVFFCTHSLYMCMYLLNNKVYTLKTVKHNKLPGDTDAGMDWGGVEGGAFFTSFTLRAHTCFHISPTPSILWAGGTTDGRLKTTKSRAQQKQASFFCLYPHFPLPPQDWDQIQDSSSLVFLSSCSHLPQISSLPSTQQTQTLSSLVCSVSRRVSWSNFLPRPCSHPHLPSHHRQQ